MLSTIESAQGPCTYLALVIVNAQAQIQLSFWNTPDREAIKDLLCAQGVRLRPEIESAVCQATAERQLTTFDSRVIFRDRGRTLRLSPLDGVEEKRFALVLEADPHDGTLERAASRYRLTRRQTEVLALVLEGASASDVAHALVISEYTAQGYIKSLLAKTISRNRAAMVARVLDWNGAHAGRPAAPAKPAAFEVTRLAR